MNRALPFVCLAVGVSACAYDRGNDPAAPRHPDDIAPVVEMDSALPDAVTNGPLVLTLRSAVLLALRNNESFRIARVRPDLSRALEMAERGAFDPVISVSATGTRNEESILYSGTTNATQRTDGIEGDIALKNTLTPGTAVEIGVGTGSYSAGPGADTDESGTQWSVTITQPLLRGGGSAANMARLRRARLATDMSLLELRGAAETLVSNVEKASWDYILAGKSIEIYEKSLDIARHEIEEVKARINVGKVAETELAAAEAELASRREELIEARGRLAKIRLALVRLLNPAGGASGWNRDLTIHEDPATPPADLRDVEEHIETAMDKRADLLQARLQIGMGEIEVARTRNGLLPKLDLFLELGGSTYAESFSDGSGNDGDDTSYGAGVVFAVPIGNRMARAEHETSALNLETARTALRNMEQLVQVDVRSAYVDVERALERVTATRATRELREKTLENERAKALVGRSTTFLVSLAQRDAVASRIAEIEAIIQYRKALLDFERSEGTLMRRRGITLQ